MEPVEELKAWLRARAESKRSQAKSRRSCAAANKNLTAADRKAARAIAEQMLGRKIAKSTAVQEEVYAQSQENVAAKLEAEAAMLEGYIELIASLEAALREKEQGLRNHEEVQALKNELLAEREQELAQARAEIERLKNLMQEIDEIVIAPMKAERDTLRSQMEAAQSEIEQLKQQIEDWRNGSQIEQEEHADLCASENIPPSDCCKPKYCSLAPFLEIKRLRSQLEAMSKPVTYSECEAILGKPVTQRDSDRLMDVRDGADAVIAARAKQEAQ